MERTNDVALMILDRGIHLTKKHSSVSHSRTERVRKRERELSSWRVTQHTILHILYSEYIFINIYTLLHSVKGIGKEREKGTFMPHQCVKKIQRSASNSFSFSLVPCYRLYSIPYMTLYMSSLRGWGGLLLIARAIKIPSSCHWKLLLKDALAIRADGRYLF